VEIEMRNHHRPWIACLVGCAFGLAGGAAFAQDDELPSAAEVLDGYVEATGGKARYQRLRTRTSKGTFSIESLGLTGRIETHQMAPDKLYSVTELEAVGKVERGYDGKVAWELNPLTGARLLDGAERAFMVREATFNADLHWRKVCKKVEMVGIELVNGEPAYKIAATTTDGASMTLYYDKYTNLLVRVDATVKMQLGEVSVEVYPSDYRAVRGILVPHTTTQKMLGMTQTVKFDSIEFNKRIDKRRFKLPAAIKDLVD